MRRGLLGLLLPLLAGAAAAADEPPALEKGRAVTPDARRVVEAAEPSVVAVVVSHSALYPPLPAAERKLPGRLGPYPRPADFAGKPPPAGFNPRLDLSDPRNIPDNLYGSGLVLDAEGLVLTAYHLIDGATKVYVRGPSGGGCYADIHAADARSDLAVLKLLDPPPGLKPVRFADVRLTGKAPTVRAGQKVVALGHTVGFGLDDARPAASVGVVSHVNRRAAGPAREDQRSRGLYHYATLIQTDARLGLACSGGAVLNPDGELVGMTTPMAAVAGSEAATGFAIPFDRNYRRIVEVLRAGREVEYGFLGVSITPGLAVRPDGLALAGVIPGTPADKAGLVPMDVTGQPVDLITEIDGHPVREQDDLFLHIGAALAGTKIKLTVTRNGRSRPVEVVLAKQEHGMPWIASNRPAAVHGLRVEYSSVLPVQGNATPRRVPAGVLVRELEPGSPAEAKFKALEGTPTGWLITHVNDQPVTTPAEFYRAAAGKPSVVLKLYSTDPNVTRAERTVTLP